MSDDAEGEAPRALSADEMRLSMLGHIYTMVNHWETVDLTRPEFAAELKRVGELRWRMEGLIHSVLVMLDGGSGLPAFNLTPAPHPDDEAFHRDNGEDWWPSGVVINECQLHESWGRMTR